MSATATLERFAVVSPRPLLLRRRRSRDAPASPAALALRALALAVVAWVPLFAIVALERRELGAFLGSWGIHVQLLVSIPALVLMERSVVLRLGDATRHLSTCGLVGPAELPGLERAAQRVARLRDSWVVEVVLVLLALGSSTAQLGLGWRLQWQAHTTELPHSMFATLWFAFVSAPILRFLLLRWLFRLALWHLFLLGVSRLKLRIAVSHPDLRGGLGFLGEALACFWWLAFAISAPVAALAPAYRLGAEPGLLSAYLLAPGAVAAICLLVVFAPLLFFWRPAFHARRLGLLDFDGLAAHQARAFEARWYPAPVETERLETQDFSALVDLGDSFRNSLQMRCFPGTVPPAILLLAGSFVPAAVALAADRRLLPVALQIYQAIS